MGAREDLVRRRMEAEERMRADDKIAREKQEADEAIQRHAKHEQLLAEIGKEADRIASLLEGADWSKAELFTFVTKKNRWWQQAREIEYACLRFTMSSTGQPALWMRSDGLLLIQEGGRGLKGPRIAFPYYDNSDSEKKQLCRMERCLQRLRGFVSIERPLVRSLP